MSKFKEVEFKYNAQDIPRAEFDQVVRSLGGIKRELCLMANSGNGKDSIDHYFTHFCPGSPSGNQRFMRWREGQDKSGTKTWELTSKIKLHDKNNNVRDEVNIRLSSTGMSFDKAKEFSSHHLCSYDFSIKKDVQIFWLDKVVLSHYTTFDLSNNKLNVFMEIEADESYPWESEEQALAVISDWEKRLSSLGITPQSRTKRSLFEFYTGALTTPEHILESL